MWLLDDRLTGFSIVHGTVLLCKRIANMIICWKYIETSFGYHFYTIPLKISNSFKQLEAEKSSTGFLAIVFQTLVLKILI